LHGYSSADRYGGDRRVSGVDGGHLGSPKRPFRSRGDAAAREVSGAAAAPLPAGIDKALEKALDKKLAPILRALAEMQEQKVRPTDVLGGLGYIFGLVGVAAYVKARGKGSRT
jgi:hypothetical protein